MTQEEKDNAIESKDYQDFVDRLICNGFYFNIDLEEKRMYINTYQQREETWSDVGFHYYGKAQIHYIKINDLDEVSDIIGDAVGTMKEYMKNETAKKLKDVIVHHLGRSE